MHRAIFLDRDGTINYDVAYLSTVRDFKFYPGVKKGIKMLHDKGFKIVVITNQSGIARGYYTERKLAQIHAKMVREIKKAGGGVDKIYYCPHHPDDNCECRKPKTKMFEKAIIDLEIDPKKSYMIGDRMWDVTAGKKMGCKAVLVPESKHKKVVLKDAESSVIKPDLICNNFSSAVKWILKDSC